MNIDSTNARQVLNDTYYIKKFYCSKCVYYTEEFECIKHRNIIKCHRDYNREVIEDEGKSN